MIELAVGCLHLCCANVEVHRDIVASRVTSAIATLCKMIMVGYGREDEEEQRQLICYLGFNALTVLYHHVETKQWIEEVMGTCQEPDPNDPIERFKAEMTDILTGVESWLDATKPAQVCSVHEYFLYTIVRWFNFCYRSVHMRKVTLCGCL